MKTDMQPSRVNKIIAVLRGWWVASKRPPDIPPHLRADLGLPEKADRRGWWDLPPPQLPPWVRNNWDDHQ